MSDDTFAALFEAQGKDRAKVRPVRVGETLDAVVVQVGRDTIFLELDGKRQAMLDTLELKGPDGTVDVQVGDRITAKVVEVDASGNVRLARSAGRGGDLSQLQAAMESRLPVEGKVAAVNKGGLEVDLGKGARGFCPLSQMAERSGADPKDFLGQTLQFLVVEIKDGGKSIVVSRRRLLEQEGQGARQRVLDSLEVGKVVRGVVSAIREFGAFVDLGGMDGLIPGSELSHERGAQVADVLKPGETVEAQVLAIKQDEKGQTRITLSLKALVAAPERPAGAPSAAGPKLAIGAVVKGKVVRIETYGVFVQVDGTDGRGGRGLIPSAELGVPRGTDLRKTFPEGTELTAKVLETGDNRLKLSVRGAKDAEERADFEAHAKDRAGAQGFGTLGDLLKKHAAKK